MTMDAWLAVPVFVLPCLVAAGMGVAFPARDFYNKLDRPAWSPPPWLFGPVWTLLYIMIAVAGWRLSQVPGPGAVPALVAWGIQIALNALWTPLFFGLRRLGVAFGEVALLWLSIAATIVLAWPVDIWAALLLIPYLAWVSFASALNFSAWRRNGDRPAA